MNMQTKTSQIRRAIIAMALISGSVVLSSNNALALPSGGVGDATVTASAGHLEIELSSAKDVMNWDSFDIADGESVNFSMASSDSILNIIRDSKASQILGSLSGAGRIYLVNNHGITFGSTAVVNVGSLVASSLTLDADDFRDDLGDGIFDFAADASNKGLVINNGVITAATGGNIALIGNSVVNTGSITALSGKVELAAGEQMTLQFDDSALMLFAVTKAVSEDIAAPW